MKVRNSKKSLNNAFWKVVLCISAPLFTIGSFAQNMSNAAQDQAEQREALLNGAPPVQPANLSEFPVSLSPYAGASSDFITHYEALSGFLDGGDIASATTALSQLQSIREINQYEATYLSLARYRLAERQGNPTEQMQHLLQMFDTAEDAQEVVVLPKELETMARRALLKLQVQNNFLREAMGTYERLKVNGDEEVVVAFESAMAQIFELAGNSVSYPVAAQLDDSGEWQIMLHKSQFYIDEVTGNVAEAVLDCAEKSQTLAVEPLFGYTVPAALGNCTITFTGDPGTSFVLTQYRE